MLNSLRKIRRQILQMQRRHNFRQAVQNAALGKVDFAPFPATIARPVLEVTKGDSLLNRQLSSILCHDELGSWAFDAATLTFLEFRFQQDQPQRVIEFGTGVSTLALACWMQALFPDDRKRIFSFEQNEWQIEKTRERLRESGFGAVEIFHAPLQLQKIRGIEGEFYSLSEEQVAVLRDVKPDWVLVDGPAGEGMTRYWPLARLEGIAAPGTRWFLDDAIRDEERAVLQAWARLPFLKVEGTFAVGKGLAQGRFTEVAQSKP